MNIEQKIYHFKETTWNIPFRDLHHTVITVCEFAKPIFPDIQPNKYLEYFIDNIDFENIRESIPKEEGLKNCKILYFGLEQLLKVDIDKAISKFQKNLSGLRFRELVEIQRSLLDLCGLLERNARTIKQGISFTQRFNNIYKSAETKEKLFDIDYQILISEFNEAIINDLLSSYKILNETINLKFPIPIETKIVLHKASQKINEFRNRNNSEIESLKPFLASKGKIVPKDADTFLFWLLDEKYKQQSFFPLPEITDLDFFEFSKYRESQLDGLEVKSLPVKQTEIMDEQEISNFTNNFDNIKSAEVYKHFNKGLVSKGYLTEHELSQYLKAAFELKRIPKTLFKFKYTPTKQNIYIIFYTYYKDIAQKKHAMQKEYAALLGDFFEGYTTKVIQTNWARDYKAKR